MATTAMLEAVFNHLVLPPKLPERNDGNIEEIELNLLNRLLRACETLRTLSGSHRWTAVRRSLAACLELNQGSLEKTTLVEAFRQLKPNDLLILHVVKQNAALLVRYHICDGGETVVFEAFEASPRSKDVLAAENALAWDFPGRSVQVPVAKFFQESFQEQLASFLEQASSESLGRFRAHTKKTKESIIESRDTTDPALVTQMLMPLLEEIGSPVDVPRLAKRVRDNVNIHKAELPWRRLPLWLILRVGGQRQFCLAFGNGRGQAFYKFLVATVLAHLLKDCSGKLAPELTMMLNAKLCRRLRKLETNRTQDPSASADYSMLFDSLGPFFEEISKNATAQTEAAWANFKKSITRTIPRLPFRADESSQCLSLPSSWPYLSSVICTTTWHYEGRVPFDVPPPGDSAMQQVQMFNKRYMDLAQRERTILTDSMLAPESTAEGSKTCSGLAEEISEYFAAVGDAYDSDPEQMSIFILNLFDLWVQMDKCAIEECSLLRDYHPVFTPELLDVLQLPMLADMRRLREIQNYLRQRCRVCKFQKSIFGEPDANCFAARYMTRSETLQDLRSQIEEASENAWLWKKSEWERACMDYDRYSKVISEGTCVCTRNPDGSREVKGCNKCYRWRLRNRMTVDVHEDFLPKDDVGKAAVVFELAMPSFFEAYRNATWRIYRDLAHPSKPETSQPAVMHLKDYGTLARYSRTDLRGVSLTSTTKSYLQSHYKNLKMKVDVSDIKHNLGLTFSYHDKQSGIWLRDLDKPLTFQHLCGVHIPRALKATVLMPSTHPDAIISGPSSYEIIASQTRCPSDMSVHEFVAYQKLFSGTLCRWPNMIVELGSSNLNFSTEDTMLVFSQLAVQAGPANPVASTMFRDVHEIFQEESFCRRLRVQIHQRLRNLTANWRETHCMEMLITLSLRMYTLTSGIDRKLAVVLLEAARKITLNWTRCLREEVRNAVEADAAERASTYGLWAALLCRRTFVIYLESNCLIPAEDLGAFVQASVALQENLVIDLDKLPQHLRNMLARDMKMAGQMDRGNVVDLSIAVDPACLWGAIDSTWSDFTNATGRTYSHRGFFAPPNDRWVQSVVSTSLNGGATVSQTVHYNYLEGHLLVDGKPLGRLPVEIRDSEDVKELFGNQHLLTFPSAYPGMSHCLRSEVWGHQIHFGLRQGQVVIQARLGNCLLEFVPRRVFTSHGGPDFPLHLINECVHWLNLSTRIMEFRRKPTIWKTRPSDWRLDVSNRRAYRKKSALVDPGSNLFRRIAGVFRHFENAERLTVYQPANHRGRLSVELRNLELSFFVNNNNLLECRELQSEIDPNQDAGTLYGFQSMIVLRDVKNHTKRSIITALGRIVPGRHGMHVAVRAESDNDFGKFSIDDTLGRLICAPEPRLIYAKALFHAITSFVLPDPLTGRTGSEEALHILKSGYSQPWTPLGLSATQLLGDIQRLSPKREYYPTDKKVQQTVIWSPFFTMNIQHDSYDAVVESILAKSNNLRAFATPPKESMELDAKMPSHLRTRGEFHRLLYEREVSGIDRADPPEDRVYLPRDRQANLPEAVNVASIVKGILRNPFRINCRARQLTSILEASKLIGGFHDVAENDLGSLSDLIETNIYEQWGDLVTFCRDTDASDKYKLIFRLALLSFGKNVDMDLVFSLAAFGCLEELRSLNPPLCPSFTEFKFNEVPEYERLAELIATGFPAFVAARGRKVKVQDKARVAHRASCDEDGERLTRFLLHQWPSPEPSVEDFESSVIDVDRAMESVLPEWKRLYANRELSDFLSRARSIFQRHRGPMASSKPSAWNPGPTLSSVSTQGPIVPSLSRDLLNKSWSLAPGYSIRDHVLYLPADLVLNAGASAKPNGTSPPAFPSKEIIELGGILKPLAASSDGLRQKYGTDLQASLAAFSRIGRTSKAGEIVMTPDAFSNRIEKYRTALSKHHSSIQSSLFADGDRFRWLQLGRLLPCTSPMSILEQLRSRSDNQFGDMMKEGFNAYGMLVTSLQRFLRMRDAQLKVNQSRLLEEWLNLGHENWSPLEFPDWLLLEIDGDFLIRPEQVDVAHAIISPASGSNSVLQLNMGKGKTSVIVPMATAVLADKKQLSRLIVPKPLLLQTAQTMQSKLGGLVGREMRHIPFTRRTPTKPDLLQLYTELHHEIQNNSGVMLTLPEHVLSYKLSGLQRIADSKPEEAHSMVNFQSWLTINCRDILDESDVSLAVKTQLIYPSGPQMSVDGHPHRWKVAQMLLSLVEDHLPALERQFPRSIEVVRRVKGFPMVHFLKTDVENALHGRIIDDICSGRTPSLRLSGSISSASQEDIKRVLSEEDVCFQYIQRVSRLFADKLTACKILLLVRGLLVNNILLLCLKKRWNVQYGLHPNRDPIAVPFEAKGVPSEQAEFGHPDVAILFTCLAFYYSGLNIAQFTEDVQHILTSDDPAAEYDRWTSNSDTLPAALRHWNVVNVDDQGQVEELWEYLRLDRNVLDHYMNHFVFPVHAKQFGVKLQASGWDIPLFLKPDKGGKEIPHVKTTGFSGTNDNKMMLPLTIKQDDLPSLWQTNAEVLSYLLEARNRQYRVAADSSGKRLSEVDLLRKISSSDIKVLIDAGSYILEMDNLSLVKAWLDVDDDPKAAVYFGDDNRALVYYRNGKKSVPLLATPFAENLEDCVVYFDQAHTRGIDLKLPPNARGALTLALDQTKDTTVQAAMRLRQLGSTQSVVFFAPPDVHQSIMDVCKTTPKDKMKSSHVISWLLEQTCRSNEQLQNLYLAQGTDFCRRTNAEWKHENFLTHNTDRDAFLQVLQNPDRQTLEQLYGGLAAAQCSTRTDFSSAQLKAFVEELDERRRALNCNGTAIHSSALEEVEQEREFELQVEEVRQIQKPNHQKALVYGGLNKAIHNFVRTGVLQGETGYEHAFSALARTGLGQKYKVGPTNSRFFVSTEFMRTVKPKGSTPNDNFLRPVEWILWSLSSKTFLIIVPEEAEAVISRIPSEEALRVVLIAYAAPFTKNMLHFNDLTYYALPGIPSFTKFPEWFTIELGIFAGRLYINHSECAPLRKYLGLEDKTEEEIAQGNGDGSGSSFCKNPVSFLMDWLPLRRKGQDIMHTPMGYLCQGRPLPENHSFFVTRGGNGDLPVAPSVQTGRAFGMDGADDVDSDVDDEWDVLDIEGDEPVDELGDEGDVLEDDGDVVEDELER